MIIGHFTRDPKTDIVAGELHTLMITRRVFLCPCEARDEQAPHYRVRTDPAVPESEVGAAWKRTSHAGVSFLSVLLDDPSFPMPCEASLFVDETHAGKLLWTRVLGDMVTR